MNLCVPSNVYAVSVNNITIPSIEDEIALDIGEEIVMEVTDTTEESYASEILTVDSEKTEEIQFESSTGVEGYVERMYSVCLDRTPDAEGNAYWIEQLKSGKETGVHSAYGFIFSEEFKNKNLCNEVFVEYLYKAFMGRNSDEAGKKYWINELETGKTREEVFNGFALSEEFSGLCNEYGITVGEGIVIPEYGTVPTGKCSVTGKEDGVTTFVTRMYDVCLDRLPDDDGLKYWKDTLYNHTKSGEEIAEGFIFSEEFINKYLNNYDFVEYMYKAFFGRPSDEEGRDYWITLLETGNSREMVFEGFIESKEFQNLCNKNGILVRTPGKHVHIFDVETRHPSGAERSFTHMIQIPTGTYQTKCECGHISQGTTNEPHTRIAFKKMIRKENLKSTDIVLENISEEWVWIVSDTYTEGCDFLPEGISCDKSGTVEEIINIEYQSGWSKAYVQTCTSCGYERIIWKPVEIN